MLVLVYGGSGSGKSEYAEGLAMKLSGEAGKRYYIATMSPEGEENQKRIRRHAALREGKAFITVEQSANVEKALCDISSEEGKKATVLLECLSNLLANEMFTDREICPADEVFQKIIKGIDVLRSNSANLVIVSNNIHEDGRVYDESTMNYIKTLGRINSYIAAEADRVIEVVAGIDIVVK